MTEPSAQPAVAVRDEPAGRAQRIRDSAVYIVVLVCVIGVAVAVLYLTRHQTSNVFSNVSLSPGA